MRPGMLSVTTRIMFSLACSASSANLRSVMSTCACAKPARQVVENGLEARVAQAQLFFHRSPFRYVLQGPDQAHRTFALALDTPHGPHPAVASFCGHQVQLEVPGRAGLDGGHRRLLD